LRERDPDCRITIITMSSLPFYNRYDLPRIFQGCHDWREILAHPPSYYDEQAITLRRHSQVTEVDSRTQTISFAHNEKMHYDRLVSALTKPPCPSTRRFPRAVRPSYWGGT
jgi:NAD(P)H-nitrite reductase large subunit